MKKKTRKAKKPVVKKVALMLHVDAKPVAEIPVPKTVLRRILDFLSA